LLLTDSQAFRRLIANSKKPLLVAGVHDALSALIAEKVGFQALWASSFGLSAVAGFPDLNILSMTEMLDALRKIRGAIEIPLIVDCDSGYGNEINAYRMAREFSRCGLTILCIEDNQFPKRCSLYDGDRQLKTIEDQVSCIRALREGSAEDAYIIARTEALVAGSGIDDALERAQQYVRAGADAILVQSKSSDGAEIIKFGKLWNIDVPLIAVPTTYWTSFQELASCRFQVIILANQLLRASVEAIERIAEELIVSNSSYTTEYNISSINHVGELIKLKQLEEMKNNFHRDC
jgi:phosphoenolpyruvate phosphomutase